MKKNAILKGTLILTTAGIISRLLGFYYRIFLTGIIGAEGLGLYQMVFPLVTICMAIASSGISVAISRYTAAFLARGQKKEAKDTLIIGTGISLLLSIVCTVFLYVMADFLAQNILKDTRCTMLIKIISLMLPLGVIHNNISSYFMGKSNAVIPAVSQLMEQIFRIGSVLLIFHIRESKGLPVTAATGMAGLLCGEIVSCLFCLTVCSLHGNDFLIRSPWSFTHNLLKMAIPISANRITLSFLHSLEAILLPAMLRKSGLSASESLSTYGILSGMAFPLIMLPSTLVNSFSAMLLPAVSGESHSGEKNALSQTILTAYECSLVIGIFCLGAFLIWGKEAGTLLFHEEQVGIYVTAFAWMCPFLYISTTLASILNGLGKTNTTLFMDVTSFSLRILLIFLLIPKMGITGYFIAFLASEIYLAILSVLALWKIHPVTLNAFHLIIKPLLSLIISAGAGIYSHAVIKSMLPALPPLCWLIFSGGIMGILYLFFMYVIFATKIKKLPQ